MTGRYRIGELIARGGVAEVFEGFVVGAEGFERRVAIKRLLPELRDDEEANRSFLDEAKIVSRLHHANIVSVFDFGSDDDGPYQVLEYVEGIDASDLRQRAEDAGATEVPVAMALYITTQVAHALTHAHEATDDRRRSLHIVHRDVSPENILLGWNGDVKLGDFGIASAIARTNRTAVGVTKGKLEYMSPEQSRADAIDERTDIFGLGCVLHTMVTGRSPLADEEARRSFFAGGPLPLDVELPNDVLEIVRRATARRPEDRHETAALLAGEAGVAFAKRATTEGRTMLREWLHALRPTSGVTSPVRGGLSELLDLGRVVPASISEEPEALDPDSMVDRQIGPYRIAETIGEGGSAVVFRVVRDDGAAFALKLLRHGKSATAETRFLREAKALESLGHPNIVKIIEAGHSDDGRPYLVLEYLRCRPLDRVLRDDGIFDIERTSSVARDIASALDAAHRAGFVHRDLKPANILISDDDGSVRLTDFGVARRVAIDDATRLTSAEQILGTPTYMAPEQIRDPRNAGPPADLYALGAVMVRMLTGRPPFSGARSEVLEAHLKRPPPNIPQAGVLMPLIFQLLSKSPDRRPASAQAVLDALPSDATRMIGPSRVRVTQRRPHRLARTLVVALAALLIAFGIGLIFGSR